MTQGKNPSLWTLRKSLSLRIQRRPYITGDPKENPINEKPKEDPITVKPKGNPINVNPQELQDSRWLLRRKKTFFGFLVVVYDREADGDKFSNANFGLGKSRFHATSHLKVEAKVFFCER